MFSFFGAKKRENFNTMPVADIHGTTRGPALLVTAGLDGDEYAGIEAAYAAAEKYKDGNFIGRLIIIPIVNVAGFDDGSSINPLDKKFPKYCIPGKARGTASEQLMHHIVQTYASQSLLWLDLHSGAMDEIAIPCLWNDVTGVDAVDTRGADFSKMSGVVAAVREQAGIASRTLAKLGCTYILIESEDEDQHASWIDKAMQQLEMIPGEPIQLPTRIFRKSRREKYPATAQNGEVILWHGERACEIAYDEITL